MGLRGTLSSQQSCQTAMNLADPELELIDPTPNIHAMFVQFDKMFFWTKLISRTTVKWSKRMYSCAGTCSFDGQACSVTLSEPLLKLRPRKDLVETLLHEMIHAYCFITNTDRDRDGHGPNFQGHMHRINRAAGLNISIYHDFHDEVKLYQTHWWRCNGVCQTKRPYFGIVRRSTNRPPGTYDHWWKAHQAMCGGTFIKIKEPEKKPTKKNPTAKNSNKASNKTVNVNNTSKNVNDITKYVTVTSPKSSNDVSAISRPVLKDSNINTFSTITNTKLQVPVTVFKGEEKTVSGKTVNGSPLERFVDAAEAVRKAWANKKINNTVPNTKDTPVSKKQKATNHIDSPPAKTRKINDYFPAANAILKDLYGDEITIKKKDNSILVEVNKSDLVECPICKVKINSQRINSHLDECLNKDVIEDLSQGNEKTETSGQVSIKTEPETSNVNVKIEPGTSKGTEESLRKCPCCDELVDKPMEQHLDECLAFIDNNTTESKQGVSNNFANETIVIDDDEDDVLNESATLNATGTKFPCPCCLEMVEAAEMNGHLDTCLS